MSDTRRQTLTVLFAITQAIAPALPALGYGITVGARDGFSSPPEVPAGYAFSIWGLIFLLSLAYAVVQALPAARNTRLYQAIGTQSWLLFALSTAWMLVAQFEGPTSLLAAIIVVMLGLALRILASVTGANVGRAGMVIVPLFGLYAGWLTLATFLNLSTLLREQGIAPVGLIEWQYAILILALAGALACSVLERLGGPFWYLAAAEWGLVAIFIQNIQADVPQMYVGGFACVLMVLLPIVSLLARDV